MNDLAIAVERLTRSLDALERRVTALEHSATSQQSLAGSPAVSAPLPREQNPSSRTQESGLLSLLGKAMLTVAGAYVLRAATAYHTIPRIPLVTLAIAYAFALLIPAVRTRVQNRLPSMVWAGTSALVFLPMIWELTLRFRILPGALTAGILVLYVVAAATLGWNHHFEEIAWTTAGSAAVASLALAIATHDLVPFIAALLVIAGVGEIAAARRRKLTLRPLVALMADVAVFALIWIYSSPAASRSVYPVIPSLLLLIAAPLLLFLYAGSTSIQTILLRRRISFFETTQALTAFVLTYWSFRVFWSGGAVTVLGMFCLASATAGYAVSFAWFGQVSGRRNYFVYATGSLALFLTGCFLSLAGIWLAISLGVFAVAASFAALRVPHLTLEFHGLAALIVIATASGSLRWSASALAGPLPGAPGTGIAMVAISVLLCSIAFLQISAQTSWHHLLALTGVAGAVFAWSALLVWGTVWAGTQVHAAAFAPHPQDVAVVRTVVACLVALGLAWSGSKWQQQELAWLAWAALALTAFKLLAEDMRHGHLAFTAVSIFLYAVTLLVVARLIRPRYKEQDS